MFMERGFDAVRVAEVAEACGVSEKTVFNYFPTKESLILDRLDATDGLAADRPGRPRGPPVPRRRCGSWTVNSAP
jgi:AcrR family transcriptional regulator